MRGSELLAANSDKQERPHIYAAHFALSHAGWGLTYPLAGLLTSRIGFVHADRIRPRGPDLRGDLAPGYYSFFRVSNQETLGILKAYSSNSWIAACLSTVSLAAASSDESVFAYEATRPCKTSD